MAFKDRRGVLEHKIYAIVLEQPGSVVLETGEKYIGEFLCELLVKLSEIRKVIEI